MEIVVAEEANGVRLTILDDGAAPAASVVPTDALAARVAEIEAASRPRWVWADTATTYARLLRAGVRVERCFDLRLCRTILRRSVGAPAPSELWDDVEEHDDRPDAPPTLFESLTLPAEEVLAERLRQREAVTASREPGRLATLLAAESAGALLAAEMRHDGLPWDRAAHDHLLTEVLGPRPPLGARPPVLEVLAEDVRRVLDAPKLNPDSGQALLRALHSAGISVQTTRKWELEQVDHPVVPPLLEYKKLSRLHSANGWVWADEWVRPGPPGAGRERFHPDYVPGGVVTGRWATRGGGALQLPKQVRGAVVADPGWTLVVADVAQLEPRVLAAMARDEAMARAARGGDLYQGLVDQGVIDTRAHAKVAMLGALYGATTGAAGDLAPRLLRAFPRATAVVEGAAMRGEVGGTVRTWLGRTSPAPPPAWKAVQDRQHEGEATDDDRRRARRLARDWGRFTRNFVVQGTAAEWALCWLADLRARLRVLGGAGGAGHSPHLVFFLHDEVIVHTPVALADDVATAVRESAVGAGRLLFGDFPVDFPLDVSVVTTYADAE
ncbi:bifunctional 3'-5' exonuclease/DNA polymerase [Georgenia satyanarayanai]|uniref:bifunctional 3'-5' exonuclease/DNA polymerase n=1 Tax=Georgenia satyanarayanai TaxID=860221 RepID=UPI00203CBFA1|nr:bifunctional 3'-5' exonuclease/DNA polymerase [Georgenia satyanarayanai]MCM3661411.1 bifunctional 3'-5' exonuclease/DNA polymerase [Georgenia satyanarayanai]